MGIAYTYTEPTIAYEYVMDCARLAHQRGLFNVMVTNGFINPEPLETLLEFIDAFNIDLKSIRDGFYKQICNGKLKPVLDTIQSCYYNGNLIEITNLVIPEYNDTQEEISDLVDFIYSIDDKIPLHLSGYHPCYELNAPPTRVNQLRKAYDIAKEKLAYVYVGNRNTDWGNNTVCPSCGNLLVERSGFWSSIIGIDKAGRCNNCGRKVDIIGRWSLEN